MSAESECVRRNVIRASVCDCVGVVMLLWNSIISQNTKNEATESSVRFIANVHALNTLMTLISLSHSLWLQHSLQARRIRTNARLARAAAAPAPPARHILHPHHAIRHRRIRSA